MKNIDKLEMGKSTNQRKGMRKMNEEEPSEPPGFESSKNLEEPPGFETRRVTRKKGNVTLGVQNGENERRMEGR